MHSRACFIHMEVMLADMVGETFNRGGERASTPWIMSNRGGPLKESTFVPCIRKLI